MKKMSIGMSIVIASLCLIITWIQIWAPYNIAMHAPRETSLIGMKALGSAIAAFLNMIATALSPLVWIAVFIVCRVFLFRDIPLKTWHGVFLAIATLPLLFVGSFVFRWPY
ncbi:hypothetical protein B5M42_023005 [Paenibacillus athensensis]|uniref:Uncharacterized protein n=1 Tax=Paenibacillus athensensis TaxID=1967502 RepID=A0A4Y8PQL3_9BACL|nr:hypothetical protein [Paenibacillus athensensis]MCD1261676.1 hypothetical protein [Paenibacillus athensensis]